MTIAFTVSLLPEVRVSQDNLKYRWGESGSPGRAAQPVWTGLIQSLSDPG